MRTAHSVVAFVAVTDLDRAPDFYGGVLGLPLSDERPYALAATLGSTSLRITRVAAVVPQPHTVLGFAVDDIEVAVGDLTARGLTCTRYEPMLQDARGIWTSPSGARVA